MTEAFAAPDFQKAALLLYLAIAYIAYIALGALPSDKAPGRRKPARVLLDRAAFFAAFGLAPVALFAALGLELPGASVLAAGEPAAWLPSTAALCLLAWAIGRFSRKSAADLASYPQYLPPRWHAGSVALEAGSWALYLFAYEFAFRGMVLYALMDAGILAAVVAETALYAFAHLPKSSKEAAGAILFGLAASWLTLAYGTVLPAFVVHLAIALANDYGSLRTAQARERNAS